MLKKPANPPILDFKICFIPNFEHFWSLISKWTWETFVFGPFRQCSFSLFVLFRSLTPKTLNQQLFRSTHQNNGQFRGLITLCEGVCSRRKLKIRDRRQLSLRVLAELWVLVVRNCAVSCQACSPPRFAFKLSWNLEVGTPLVTSDSGKVRSVVRSRLVVCPPRHWVSSDSAHLAVCIATDTAPVLFSYHGVF